MADSVSKSSETEIDAALAELKQVESQLVSLNFVLKNTQSEVIKLQKTLARNQTHQEEIDKKLAKLEADFSHFHNNQAEEEAFRNRFWFYQLVTVGVSLILFMLIHGMLPQPTPPVSTAPHASSSSSPNPGEDANGTDTP